MSNTKGQGAMEFLMTYGLAILVVLVIVGLLLYPGILNLPRLGYNEAYDTCDMLRCGYKGFEAETGMPLTSSYQNFTCPETFGKTGIHKTKENCLRYHPKTPEEKEVGYCNTNSTDSSRCFCLEKKNLRRINVTTVEKNCIKNMNGLFVCYLPNNESLFQSVSIDIKTDAYYEDVVMTGL